MGTPVHSQKYYVDVHTSLAKEEKVLVTDCQFLDILLLLPNRQEAVCEQRNSPDGTTNLQLFVLSNCLSTCTMLKVVVWNSATSLNHSMQVYHYVRIMLGGNNKEPRY
jgi:hypothetical protein